MRAGGVLKDFVKGGRGEAGVRELAAFCKNKPQLPPEAAREREKQTLCWFALDEVLDPKTMAAIQSGFVR